MSVCPVRLCTLGPIAVRGVRGVSLKRVCVCMCLCVCGCWQGIQNVLYSKDFESVKKRRGRSMYARESQDVCLSVFLCLSVSVSVCVRTQVARCGRTDVLTRGAECQPKYSNIQRSNACICARACKCNMYST
jgi:hypothetical protein